MQTYDTPNSALEAFEKELNQRKKTPEQIVVSFIKQGIITQPIVDKLIQLAEYKKLIEDYENVAASVAWSMLTKRAVESPITA